MNDDDFRDACRMLAMLGIIIRGKNIGSASIAIEAFEQADAMLEERNKEDEDGIATIKKRKYVRKP